MRTKEIKSVLLKKGWAGRTISRQETIARLNPLMAQHVVLSRLYDQVVSLAAPEAAYAEELAQLQRKARTDMGKLAETIFSCGGVAYSGADRPVDAPPVTGTWAVLLAEEQALGEALHAERTIEHQMRTEAVLRRCAESSAERLAFVLGQARRQRTIS